MYNEIIRKYIHCNIKIIITILILFVIGSIVGIIIANNVEDSVKNQIIIQIEAINENISNGTEIDEMQVFISTAKTIIIYTTIIVFLGLNMFFAKLIYVVPIYKGISIGFSLSYIIMIFGSIKGIIFGLAILLIPNLCLLVHIILISTFWIKFNSKFEYENHKKFFMQNMALTAISMGIFGILLIIYQWGIITYIDNFIKIL